MSISCVEKVWNINECDDELVKSISSSCNISEFLARLLIVRGIDSENAINSFLNKETDGFYDPFLLKDMDKAVLRISQALDNEEKITIYGDYDVDGITSVAILYLYLKRCGAIVEYYIPERLNEGYGLNLDAMKKIADKKTELLITVDSGITAHDEINYMNKRKVDVIITDHHECREELPNALAVINPHRKDSIYPFCDLAGVGVAFKLICALNGESSIKKICADFCDLVSIGTVADVMPLISENRLIVSLGLHYLKNTKNIGLNALIEEILSEKANDKQRRITSSLISFGIAPRINAAGRIGNVNTALELMISSDCETAKKDALTLCKINKQRKEIENVILNEAIEIIENTHDFEKDKVIVISSEKWHLGVIGIVASRIVEKYYLPTIIISFDGELGKGSARSIKGFNINEALSKTKDKLLKYGGHELAAGLSIEKDKLEQFKKSINEYANSFFGVKKPISYINADFEVDSKYLNIKCASEIEKLEPFGISNSIPVFCCKNMKICESASIGLNKHMKLVLSKDDEKITALYFNIKPSEFAFSVGFTVDCLFNLDINEFRGEKTVQIIIKDIRHSENTVNFLQKEQIDYLDILEGIKPKNVTIPDINQFKFLFLYLRFINKENTENLKKFNVLHAARTMPNKYRTIITPSVLNLMLDVFSEMRIIEVKRLDISQNVELTLLPSEGKVNLNESEILKKINS